VQAIIFDFDGVIANSEPLHFRAFRDEVATHGIQLTEAAYYSDYLGFDDAGAFRAMAVRNGVDWSDAAIARMVASKAERIEALERDVSVLFPGAAEAVRRAAAAVPIGIASGALTREIQRTLAREELSSLFTVVVGADQTKASKPAPDPYLRAVEVMSVRLHTSIHPRRCIAIEDSVWGLESAHRAGLVPVGVAHTYHAEALSLARFVIPSIEQLDIPQLKSLVSE
jgi:beta-phosphoglucomutase-like phosphatase (HAD superfamily)